MQDGFKSLIVWKKAYELGLLVYQLTKNFPKDEQYGLTTQMRRAAISISGNIAEGYERQHRKEYIQFLMIARGSLGELETYLMFAWDLRYINQIEFDNADSKRREVGKLFHGLIKSLIT